MQQLWEKYQAVIIQYGMSLVAAVLIVVIGKWVAKVVARLLEAAMSRAGLDKTLASFTKNLAYFGIMIFVVIAALGKLGVQTGSFVAIIGAAGLAVGLALQGSLANFAAGVMIIMFEPFKAGDTVEAGGAAGTVDEIQIFNTVFTTADNKKVIVPNAKITSDKIVIHPRAK